MTWGIFRIKRLSVSSKRFCFGAVCQLVLSWCWQGNIFPLENNPIAFPACCCFWLFFFAVASWLHIPSLGVSAALSLDIASSCFLAVCPFATADPLSSWTSCLLIPLQCGACWFLVLIHSSLGFLCSCYLEGLKPYCHADCAKLFQFATLLTK